MQCEQCGNVMIGNERFCSQCGVRIKLPAEYSEESDPEQNVSDVIGKNADYYIMKWKADRKITWNWAAFFLTVFWVGYRRMYGSLLIIICIWLGTDIVLYWLEANGSPIDDSINYAIGTITGIILGLFGNKMYYHHIQKKMRDRRNGGTSFKGVGVAVFSVIIYTIFSAGVLYENMVPSQVEFGYNEQGGAINQAGNMFSPEETMYYEFYFPRKGGDYEVIIEKKVDGTSTIYSTWEDSVPPDWSGVINSTTVPSEPGEYEMKIVMGDAVVARGSFFVVD